MSEKTAGSPKHKPGRSNSQYNTDGTKKKYVDPNYQKLPWKTKQRFDKMVNEVNNNN
mgnify:FL=1|tara:strand:+ start:1754 stop:1924 length:171 start_codon:yes stop_codon:yes gene_type:complete